MERLTDETQIGPFAALKDKAEADPGAFGTYDCLYAHMVAVTRLKEYEDTGLEPEAVIAIKNAIMGQKVDKIIEFDGIPIRRLQELAKTKKDGRLVVLPCKVGDTVWCISGAYKTISQYTAAGYLNDGFRWKVRMTKAIPSWVGNKMEHKYVAFNSFGKIAFLTREEAEAALKKMEDADNEKSDSNRL